MSMTDAQGGGFQQQVLWRFTALLLLRESWAGELLLGAGLDENGAALALAAHIAGAVCLSVDADAERVKAAQRRGACDFAVNSLDEALRTMKNEVRLGRALSVGLLGNPEAMIAEMEERGVLPAIAAGFAAEVLGSKTASFSGMDALAEEWAGEHGLRMCFVSASGLGDLMALDEALKRVVGEDRLRMRWLERGAQHFRRERPLGRAVWLNQAEAEALRAMGRVV
jgi:urocanate hydratase